MAAPINTPLTGEIWHLTIDDLLAPLPKTARLGGSGPFVINLSASSAPIAVPGKRVPGCQNAYVYQVQRMEDRRLRYRLRLGPFAKEDEANVILKKVRDLYPGALTATADSDDLRAIATMQAKTAMPPPLLPVASAPAGPAQPASSAVPARVSPPVLMREQKLQPSSAPVARNNTPIARRVGQIADRIPTLECTQTVRALTSSELEDTQAARWFVIELSLAAHPFDPDTVPNLDIFSVYRLYSVAEMEQGRIVHALRLGFFGEENAARAVASYLAAFYAKPTIKRVSTGERQRFSEQPLEPRKDVGATGKQAIIEITSELFVRALRSG
ncbi:MAG TPA: hypothetical protein VGO37_11945 [Steroidobacteraceae bacterium]|jgi:hypothetical protein|nr:hypothetical protein [Steroidobacteraceae bacterium]